MKKNSTIVWLLSAVYMISYMTRINYGAVISAIEADTLMSKAVLSAAVTGGFITYGAGQIVSGFFGDKFSPKRLIIYGLVASSAMNLILPFCTNAVQMTAVWCVNGLAQAFMWPPMVKIMTSIMSDDEYAVASVKVSWGASFGTIAIYLVSPLILSLAGWKAVFFFCAACGVVMICLWSRFGCDVKIEHSASSSNENKSTNSLFSPLMLMIMLAIVLQGMLRDGVTTWMPSYIAETYNIGNGAAILSGVALPIFSIVCFKLASILYKKRFKNPMLCAGVIFAAGTFAASVLLVFTGGNAVVSVVFSAILTGCMHGVNLILICMVPPYFYKYGNTSLVSGLLNSCTYVGSAISAYGIAFLTENFGWRCTLVSWLIAALAGTIVCVAAVHIWKHSNL